MARVIDSRSITTACPWCSTIRSSMNGCRTCLTKATALMKTTPARSKLGNWRGLGNVKNNASVSMERVGLG